MILQTLAWKLQKWQVSSPSPFSSPFLFFLLPSAAATCSASISAPFPKEQDNFIVCSQLFMSPHCYRTNFLNCHLGHSLLCQPISSDPLPSPLVLPSKLQVYYPSHWIQCALSLFWGNCLCSHWALRTVSIHITSVPTEIQFALKALLTHTWTASIPQVIVKSPESGMIPQSTLLYMQYILNKYKKKIKLNPPLPTHTKRSLCSHLGK